MDSADFPFVAKEETVSHPVNAYQKSKQLHFSFVKLLAKAWIGSIFWYFLVPYSNQRSWIINSKNKAVTITTTSVLTYWHIDYFSGLHPTDVSREVQYVYQPPHGHTDSFDNTSLLTVQTILTVEEGIIIRSLANRWNRSALSWLWWRNYCKFNSRASYSPFPCSALMLFSLYTWNIMSILVILPWKFFFTVFSKCFWGLRRKHLNNNRSIYNYSGCVIVIISRVIRIG